MKRIIHPLNGIGPVTTPGAKVQAAKHRTKSSSSDAARMAAALRQIRELQAYAMTDGRGMRGDNGDELESIIATALREPKCR